MNPYGIKAIYRFEMARWGRTLWQSLVAPVITTSLYFLVFGSAIGSRMSDMAGIVHLWDRTRLSESTPTARA